jgi:hypothetical protein
MAQNKPLPAQPAMEDLPARDVEHFSVPVRLLQKAQDHRLDASYFNPDVAKALEALRHSGMIVKPLGDIVERVFLPPRVKRVYVGTEHGLPFLRGSHIVHFQPADLKYVSRRAQKHIDQLIVRKDWILITRSGTVGRVMLCPEEWDGWAGTEDLLRVVPNEGACPGAYLYAFLASPLGHIQLIKPIFGAVVDHLTEDQTKNVLVPLPTTDEQRRFVRKIAEEARDAMEMRSRAVSAISEAVQNVQELIHEYGRDVAIARERLAEIEETPSRLVRGEKLRERLAKIYP